MTMIAKETYKESEDRIGKRLDEFSQDTLRRNGEEEKRLALEAGDVIKVEEPPFHVCMFVFFIILFSYCIPGWG